MKFKIIFLIALLKLKRFGYIGFVRCKIIESALVGCKSNIGAQSALRTFFVRKISMRSHLNGEAGEGHIYVCRSPVEPVCQPFSALPPII